MSKYVDAEPVSVALKVCRQCGEEKPLDEFWRNKDSPDGRLARCRVCLNGGVEPPRRRSPAEYLAVDGHKRCGRCHVVQELTGFSRDNRRPDRYNYYCKMCRSKASGVKYVTDVEFRRRQAESNLKRMAVIRKQVQDAYGGKCACCGETTEEFLAVDHINGGGGKHAKEIGKGRTFYLWIVRNGFPKGLQLLCHNCNMSLGHRGYCPHHPEVVRKVLTRARKFSWEEDSDE